MAHEKELLLIDGVLYERSNYNYEKESCTISCEYEACKNNTEAICPVIDMGENLRKSSLQPLDLREELIKYECRNHPDFKELRGYMEKKINFYLSNREQITNEK